MNPKLLNLQIVQVRESVGNGTELNPYRKIRAWYTTDGRLIVRWDEEYQTMNEVHMGAIDLPIKE